MLLRAEGISRDYFRNGRDTNFFTAVKKTNLEIEKGSCTAVSGRSGSGKTTLINMLSGLLTPTEGRVLFDGEDIYAMSDSTRAAFRNRNIGIVPQGQTGLKSLTVLENILLPAVMYGNEKDKTEKARKLMKQLSIEDLEDVFANELSGGELRRMAIIRAMINSPRMIIADEPTGDLDDISTEAVMKLFDDCIKNGCAVIIVTHEAECLSLLDVPVTTLRVDDGVIKTQSR